MEKQFLPYQQALALKELGFEEQCLGAFNNQKEFEIVDVNQFHQDFNVSIRNFECKNSWYSKNGNCITAPLYQQAFKFFREKYGLSASILLKMRNSKKVSFYIINELDNRIIKSNFFNSKISSLYKTYEEAELECLKKLIGIAEKEIKNAN